MKRTRILSWALMLLGALIVIYALLGPMFFDVIHFRTSPSGLNQIRGGDLVALLIVAPLCLACALLARRARRAAAVLALAPAMFAMYTYSQLMLANEFLQLPGNVERFFPLLLAIFLLAAAITMTSWGAVHDDALPPWSRRLEGGSGILLLVVAGFIVVGIHLPSLVDALQTEPTGVAYLSAPVAFWVVKFYDLAIVTPAAITVGVGLLTRQPWAKKPAYAILGGYVLIGWSVSGMAWSMLLNHDPDASIALALGMTGLVLAATASASVLYRPLFRPQHLPEEHRNPATARADATGSQERTATQDPADIATDAQTRGHAPRQSMAAINGQHNESPGSSQAAHLLRSNRAPLR